MTRREVIALFAGASLVWPLSARSQPAQRIYRIGFLTNTAPRAPFGVLFAVLRELGYEEGRNLVVDFRSAQGREDLVAGLAADLVAAKVDLIVAPLNGEILAAKRATSTVPIVMVWSSAPEQSGLIASLAQPGGNLTGTTLQPPETAGKMLQVLRDAVPGMRRVTIIGEPSYPGMQLYRRATDQAAEAMGIRLTYLSPRTLADIEAVLAQTALDRPDALFVVSTGVITVHRARVIEFAARQRLPALYTDKRHVLEGGLISYTADLALLQRRTAAIIDKILKGAKPAEIPVEQPTRYEMVVNLKTFKALGIKIPEILLLQATELIE